MIGLRTLLGGKFGVYIVGITALASFAAGFQVCQWRSGAAETVEAKTQIRETQAQIERVTQEGRHVEQTISERRRDADRHVRQADRNPSLDRVVDDCTSRVLSAALNREPAPSCVAEPAGEVPAVSERPATAGEGQ